MSDRELWRAIKELRNELDQLRAVSRITYAKSTWTPTYVGSTTPGTTTYTTQVGYYIRTGLIVVASAQIIWTAVTGTGQVRLGLPFTSMNLTGLNWAFAVYTDSVTFANGSVQGRIQPNTNQARLFSPATNAASTELNIEAAGTLIFTAVYFVQ